MNNIALSRDYNITAEKGVLSEAFYVIKWLLALSVVADHFFRTSNIEIGLRTYNLSSNEYVIFLQSFIESFFKSCAVPVFFIISGYFFYSYAADGFLATFKKVIKKIRTLVYPYFVWNVLAIILSVLFIVISSYDDIYNEIRNIIFPIDKLIIGFIGKDFGYYPHNLPLWYIRDLVFLMLLSPFICKCLKQSDKLFLAVIITVFILFFHDKMGFRLHVGICFFSIGMWLKMKNYATFSISKKKLVIGFLIYAIAATFHYRFYDTYPVVLQTVKNINIILFSILIIYGVYFLAERNQVKIYAAIAQSSLLIYMAHYPLMQYSKHFIFGVMNPDDDFGCLIALMVSYVCLIIFLISVYLLLDKYGNNAKKFLFGR